MMTRMSATAPVEFVEDRVPHAGIEGSIAELVELYGGEITGSDANLRRFTLPLRRGVATAGGVGCTLTWSQDDDAEATLTLSCDRQVDAPKFQRVALLAVGVVGAVLFMIWPFFPQRREFGTLAWLGGAVAIAVYLLTLRRTSGGVAFDFLQRLAKKQRTDAMSVRDDR
jgi:hypothetical protein